VDLALQSGRAKERANAAAHRTSKTGVKNGTANGNQADGLKKIEDLIGHYFRKFGSRLLQAILCRQLTTHRLADLIDKDLGTPQLRTQFLRSDPVAGKVSWINDVTNEKSVLEAGRSLTATAAPANQTRGRKESSCRWPDSP